MEGYVLFLSAFDEEDFFMVTDLLLGGDLRYHIQQEVEFSEDAVKLMVCELGLALDYLQSKKIIHRDVKPDNILLDEEGHAHLTDFNIAAVLEDGQLATSMSGTKPYIAPEIFDCVLELCVGYSYPVDWWSLGVVAYEMLRGSRPFDIHSNTSLQDVRSLFQTGVECPGNWSDDIVDLLHRLLCVRPGERISSVEELKQVKGLNKFNMDDVLKGKYKPGFSPPKGHLNCDPTFELEEMIIEAKPLHKKKKRLAKQRSIREMQGQLSLDLDTESPVEGSTTFISEFKVYNRYQELEKREREKKELQWEKELEEAMKASDPLSGIPGESKSIYEHPRFNKRNGDYVCRSEKIETLNSNENQEKDNRTSDLGSSDCSKCSRKESKTPCSLETKIDAIDYIDRSPSPLDRLENT